MSLLYACIYIYKYKQLQILIYFFIDPLDFWTEVLYIDW